MKGILSWLNPQAKGSGQRPAQDHHIDKPADGSVNTQVEESVDSSVSQPIDGSVNGPVNTQVTLEVTVIPVCEKDNTVTPTSAISKGLIRLSQAMEAMNSLPTVKTMPGETGLMASFINNALDIMATVPDKDRPERIYTYHVYATRTGIATFFNLMNIIVKHLPKSGYGDPNASDILQNTFSAYLYFGIAILSTPVPLSAHIAAAIRVEVNTASNYTSALSPEKTSIIAKKIMEIIPPRRRIDIRPLLSIFTSDQLAGLARRMACHIDPHEPDQAAKRMIYRLFDLDIDVPPQFCPCKEDTKNFPICLCRSEPYSQSLYDRVCSKKLLPVI